jgi:8-oxo-dGTP diphosphatase
MIPVTAAIILHNNQVLAARRAQHKHMGGYWEFPGGKIETGETPEQSLARELLEEMGITVQVGGHFYTNQHDYGEKQIMLSAYFCNWSEGDLTLNDHDAIKWCVPKELLSLDWAPADIPIVQALVAAMDHGDQRIELS